jgi:hypothetical protein
VRSVTAADGQALSFLQEDKNDGAELRRDFAEGAKISRPLSRSIMTQEMNLDGNKEDGLDLHRVRLRGPTALIPDERNLRHGGGRVGGRGCGDEYEDDAVERERQFPDAGAIDLELPSGMSSWEELTLQATARSMRRFL